MYTHTHTSARVMYTVGVRVFFPRPSAVARTCSRNNIKYYTLRPYTMVLYQSYYGDNPFGAPTPVTLSRNLLLRDSEAAPFDCRVNAENPLVHPYTSLMSIFLYYTCVETTSLLVGDRTSVDFEQDKTGR